MSLVTQIDDFSGLDVQSFWEKVSMPFSYVTGSEYKVTVTSGTQNFLRTTTTTGFFQGGELVVCFGTLTAPAYSGGTSNRYFVQAYHGSLSYSVGVFLNTSDQWIVRCGTATTPSYTETYDPANPWWRVKQVTDDHQVTWEKSNNGITWTPVFTVNPTTTSGTDYSDANTNSDYAAGLVIGSGNGYNGSADLGVEYLKISVNTLATKWFPNRLGKESLWNAQGATLKTVASDWNTEAFAGTDLSGFYVSSEARFS